MDTPDPLGASVRRTRILDTAATILGIGGLIAAVALGGNASANEDPNPLPALTFGALLWVAAAVLAGASVIAKAIIDTAPAGGVDEKAPS
ncbi:hypothetical protein GCM10009827_084290 [Dactylosporangium maewongense]|uniref:Amino acid transporter n=1 Tax=Dactylosporangium maewongense TaxID=634393 RepID=A0ABP4MV53_9ACTN